MAEYIKRETVINHLDACMDTLWKPEIIALKCFVEGIPAADVAPVRQWISVKDRLPKNGEYVLCWYEYFRYGDFNAMFEAYGIGYCYNGHWGGEVANGTKARVLAWMPLPEPPKGDADNG